MIDKKILNIPAKYKLLIKLEEDNVLTFNKTRHSYLRIKENCDGWYSTVLDLNEVKQLANELIQFAIEKGIK